MFSIFWLWLWRTSHFYFVETRLSMYFLINFIILWWYSLSYCLWISWNQEVHWRLWFHRFDLINSHLHFLSMFLYCFHNWVSYGHEWTYSLTKLSFKGDFRFYFLLWLNLKIKDILSLSKYAFLSTFAFIRHNVEINRSLFIHT